MMDDTLMTIIQVSTIKRRASRGVSLVIVLIMMIIIGITASTAMRSATSEQRATNNQRMEATALQYAEAALRYCESEIAKTTGRTFTLQEPLPNTTGTGPEPNTGWEDPLSWTGSGIAGATLTPVPPTFLQINAAESVVPDNPPQCVAERVSGVLVITARGFSTDYDATPGATRGAVVWVQSATN
ncbi:MAG: PilX N-terminal domain-containing pilus assembly protein [Pseudomonadota bacterium]